MIEVKLPIGIEDSNGNRFNTVIVDKMRGVDEYNIETADSKSNPEKAFTSLVRRSILEIPGYLRRKNNPEDFIDGKIAENMYAVDREAVLIGMLLQNPKTNLEVTMTCKKCGYRLPTEQFELKDAEINKDFTLGSPTEIPFELDEGFTTQLGNGPDAERNTYKTGVIRFLRGTDAESVGTLENSGEIGTSLLFRCCKFDGVSVTRKTFEMLSTMDRIHLFKILYSEIPHYNLTIVKECPDCHKKVKETVSLLSFFALMRADD